MSDERRRALTAAAALRDLGRAERPLIEQGRLEALPALAARRAELLRELDATLGPGAPADRETRALLDIVRREGAENLTLLRAAQAELTRELSAAEQAQRAVGAYGGASKL